jgi:hypothetical protein
MDAAYTLYSDDTGIAVSPSLDQLKLLALDQLREGRHVCIRGPTGLLIVYDESRRDWSEEIRQP